MPRPPAEMQGFIGQKDITRSIQRTVEGALIRNLLAPHMAFLGPPGHGKSVLAEAVVRLAGSGIHKLSAATARARDIARCLSKLKPGGCVLIDEAHALDHRSLMLLNTAVDELRVPSARGGGASLEEIAPFTLLITTHRWGTLDAAFRSRFIRYELEPYTDLELIRITQRVGRSVGFELTTQACRLMLEQSDRSPRQLGAWVRHMALVFPRHVRLKTDQVRSYLRDDRRIRDGLGPAERNYLRALGHHQLTQRAIATAMAGGDTAMLANRIEPLLIRRGLLDKPRGGGRRLTPLGLKFLAEIEDTSTSLKPVEVTNEPR